MTRPSAPLTRATVAIVHQFCGAACRGLVTWVAHLEQPVFPCR
jgi:hypothetical protein